MKLVCVLELDGRRFILLFDKENMYKDRNVLHNDLHVFVELCLFIVTCSLLLFIHNCGNVFRKCSLINFKKLSNFTFLIIYHFFNFDLFVSFHLLRLCLLTWWRHCLVCEPHEYSCIYIFIYLYPAGRNHSYITSSVSHIYFMFNI